MRDFVQFHVHTKYSEKDAMPEPIEYAKKVNEYIKDFNLSDDSKALAITEHGHMVSMYKHYKTCKEENIKAIIGCEFYVVSSMDNFLTYKKTKRKKNKSEEEEEFTEEDNINDLNHLVLIAKNNIGLKNLFKLATFAGTNRFKANKDKNKKTFNVLEEKHLKDYGEGIICLTACIGGLIPKLILQGKRNEVISKIEEYKSYFDEIYLEVQPHEVSKQLLINKELVELSEEYGYPLIITTDAHYISKDDKPYHEVLKLMDRIPKDKLFEGDNHFRSPEEIEQFCMKYEIPLSAMDNTIKIAKECNVNPVPNDSKGLMPSFECPKGYTEESYLRELVSDGVMEKIITKGIKEPKIYIDRMLYELEIICSMGFAGYFLILWDWLKWCRDNGILTGKGRGSAGGSIVSYSLNITSINPIRHKCIFERFLNPSRIEFPDIDSDISRKDRKRAIEYLEDKYGIEFLSQIITVSEYGLKNTIKGVMSACGYPYDEANEATKKLPDKIMGITPTFALIEGLVNNPDDYEEAEPSDIESAQKTMTMLEELFNKYPEVYLGVSKLKGCVSGYGCHASGIVISSKPLIDYMPFIEGDSAILPVSQLNMDDLHDINVLKIDALGLNTLTQIKECMDLIGLSYDWWDNENYENPKVYEMLKRGETADVFQMAKFVPTKMMRDFDVNNIEGITAVNAGDRPGCLAKSIWDEDEQKNLSMVDLYIKNRKEFEKTGIIPSLDPRIDHILKDTYGCIFYQEQCIQIGQIMAGYSLGAADIRLRKTFAKKLHKLIPEIENEFIYGKKSIYGKRNKDDKEEVVIGVSNENSEYCVGALANGFDEATARKIFNIMKEFAAYAFNLSHSAAYGTTAYKTAELSLEHPVEWAVACCNHHDNNDKIAETLKLAKQRNVSILPPDVNMSGLKFTVEEMFDGTKTIRYPLYNIKDAGETALNIIFKAREEGEFKDFDDFYKRTHDNPIVDEYLWNEEKDKKDTNPLNRKAEIALIEAGAFDSFNSNRYELLNYYCMNIRKEKDYDFKNPSDYTKSVKLNFEQDRLGLYLSSHPLDSYPYVNIMSEDIDDNEVVATSGKINKIGKPKQDRRGRDFCSVIFEDKTGKVFNFKMFGNTYEAYKNKIKVNDQVIIKGRVSKQWESITVDELQIIMLDSMIDTRIKQIEKKNEKDEKKKALEIVLEDDELW